MKCNRFFCIASVVILCLPCYAQIITTGNKKQTNINGTQSPQVIETSIMKGDSVISSYKLDLNEKIKLIVQFKEPSLALVKAAKRTMSTGEISSARSRIETEHSMFKSDLQKIEANVLARHQTVFTSAGNQIVFEYKTAINGMAIATKRWMVEEIKKLPYVKSVYEDKEVKAYDDQSNHVIGADSVWHNLGVTGTEIIIGILDTGIDYLHPDLGGGIGPGFKVLGGYDFINNDNDPMDDHGHGTHTAGIAAAKGKLKGVAPDASLYAFKVLDQYGSGSYSVIIAGIERALDPDQNPNTNDAVDIISMSLGGNGSPDDIVAQAIDNATRAGVICVIAAGNSGSYLTIGSPGCARTALTVGATDDNDIIAYFSSRGPSNKIYEIKPDIVAPGVSINSTKMGGGYIAYSGTSMSTPHVAGCAALLLQLHPDWNPYVVKSALMQSAKSIGLDPLTQGHGRVDVYKASKTKIVTIPASFAFGLIDVNLSSFSKSDTLYVKNLDSSAVTYSVSAYGLPSGASLTLSKNTIALQPYDSVSFIATLNVDNNTVADADPSTVSYFGHLILASPVDSMTVPFSFVKYPYVNVQFNGGLLLQGVLHNRSDLVKYTAFFQLDEDNIKTFFAPKGTYDIIGYFAIYPDPIKSVFVVKENISVPASSVVQLDVSQATSTLDFNLVTQDNTPVNLSKCGNFYNFLYKSSGLGIHSGAMGFDYVWSLKYNNISTEYVYDWEVRTYRGFPAFYSYYGSLTDFSQSYNHTNLSTDFKHLKVHYNLSDPPKNLYILDWAGMSSETLIVTSSMSGWGYQHEDYLLPPFIQDWYLSPLPPGFPYKSTYTNYCSVYEGGPISGWNMLNSKMYFVTPSITATDKNTAVFSPPSLPKYRSLSYNGSEMTFGLGPSHWGGTYVNSLNYIDFKSNGAIGEICDYYPNGVHQIYPPLFPSQFQDSSPKNLHYSLFRNGQLVESDDVINKKFDLVTEGFYDFHFRIPVNISGKYTLQIQDTNYSIRGRQGKALMKATFDLSKIDKNPPTIHSLNVIENGEFTDNVEVGQNASIQFSVTDDVGLQNVSLSYYSDSDTSHQYLSLVKNSDIYTSPIENLPNGYISLKIIAEDNSGNILEYEMEPGFKFGINNPPLSFHLFSPADGDTMRLTLPPKAIKLTWDRSSDVDRDFLLYSLTLKGPNIDTVFNSITDTSVVLNIMPRLSTASLYKWTVGVFDGVVTVASLDTFRFKTSDIISSVKVEINNIPTVFSLAQNYPNPFNPSTTINYDLPKESKVLLKVFNILGQEISTLVNEQLPAGRYSVLFQSQKLGSGVYFYRICAGEFVDAKKFILLR
jgi:subtilisin family serine protease